MREDADDLRAELRNTFGDLAHPRPQDDLLVLARKALAGGTPLPRILQMCGTGDYLHSVNTGFRDALHSLGIDFLYEEGPGEHNWAYWDAGIQRVLEWLELKKG
jgi:S-formylglutathione hydrolase FrmB